MKVLYDKKNKRLVLIFDTFDNVKYIKCIYFDGKDLKKLKSALKE
jgi:hypothetical protein